MATGTDTEHRERASDVSSTGVLRAEAAWLGGVMAAVVVVYLSYLATHPYPAFGAGLYLEIAQQIRVDGYTLPTRISHYTADGVPYAYPPLLFVVAAVVRDVTGVGAITYARYLPGLVTVAYVVPYYSIARELLASRARAATATLLFATAPPVLQWHLSAGGIVRAPAMLFALSGVYTGIRLFRTGDRRWLVPSTLLFALTLSSHPMYAAFFGVSYLLLYAQFDRSARGLAHGAVVAVGGLALVSPWVWIVAQRHGVGVFTAASGTHGGLGGGVAEVIDRIGWPPTLSAGEGFALPVLGAGVYLLATRRVFLPAWTVLAAAVLADSRFLFVAGAMAGGVVLFDCVLRPLRRCARTVGGERAAVVAFAVLLVVATTGTGVLFASSSLDSHGGSRSQPQFIGDADREAMAWAETHTEPGAEFVVLGDAAEWFPYFADRTVLVAPWGVEWKSADRYQRQLALYRSVSTCGDAACVTRSLRRSDYRPDYLYVPTSEYMVRGFVNEAPEGLHRSLVASDGYQLRYENDGVLVFRVESLAPVDGTSDLSYRSASVSRPSGAERLLRTRSPGRTREETEPALPSRPLRR